MDYLKKNKMIQQCKKCGYRLRPEGKKFWCGYCKKHYNENGKAFTTVKALIIHKRKGKGGWRGC